MSKQFLELKFAWHKMWAAIFKDLADDHRRKCYKIHGKLINMEEDQNE